MKPITFPLLALIMPAIVAQGCFSPSNVASSAARNTAKSSSGSSASASPAESSSERVDITPEQLIAEFRNNSVRAQDLYKGKTLRLTGRVSQVSNDLLGSENAAVVIKVDDGTWLPPSIEIWYGPSFRDRIGKLSEGQNVTCEGTFEDMRFSGSVVLKGLALQ